MDGENYMNKKIIQIMLAILLAFALMLEALGKLDDANKLREALAAVVEEGTIVTPDIGGSASTDEFTAAIIRKLG